MTNHAARFEPSWLCVPIANCPATGVLFLRQSILACGSGLSAVFAHLAMQVSHVHQSSPGSGSSSGPCRWHLRLILSECTLSLLLESATCIVCVPIANCPATGLFLHAICSRLRQFFCLLVQACLDVRQAYAQSSSGCESGRVYILHVHFLAWALACETLPPFWVAHAPKAHSPPLHPTNLLHNCSHAQAPLSI